MWKSGNQDSDDWVRTGVIGDTLSGRMGYTYGRKVRAGESGTQEIRGQTGDSKRRGKHSGYDEMERAIAPRSLAERGEGAASPPNQTGVLKRTLAAPTIQLPASP